MDIKIACPHATIANSRQCGSRCSLYKSMKSALLTSSDLRYAQSSSTLHSQELRLCYPLSPQRTLPRCEQFAATLTHRSRISARWERHDGTSLPQVWRKQHSKKVVNAILEPECMDGMASICLQDGEKNFKSSAARASVDHFCAMQCTLDRIQSAGVIACLRSQSAEVALDAGRAAIDGGVSVLEVTMRTPGATKVIERLVHEYPSATIGAGTVLTWQDAERAKAAGATFLMSPVARQSNGDGWQLVIAMHDASDGLAIVMKNREKLVRAHRDSRVLFIPGAMTPTEVLKAFRWGASCVKLYPVSLMGGGQFVQMLKSSFPYIPLIASNGITLDTVESYMRAGATAVVLSDAIFDKSSMAKHDYAQISQRAKVAAHSASVGKSMAEEVPERSELLY